jgi:hypothetical protein
LQTFLARAPYAAIVFTLLALICGAAMACCGFGYAVIEQGLAEQARLQAKAGCLASIETLQARNPWAAAVFQADYRRVEAQERRNTVD